MKAVKHESPADWQLGAYVETCDNAVQDHQIFSVVGHKTARE